MSYLTEQASYLKGMFDGGDFDETTKEGKLLKALISLVGEMSEEIGALYEELDELQSTVDEIDDDLAEVEDELFGEYDEDCDDDDDWDFDDDDELAIECPNCGDMIYLDPALLEESEQTITCPNCKEDIELEFTDECGCGCDDCE